MIYGSWDIKCNFFVILGHFLPFFPPRSPKYENIKKMKKHLEIPSFYTGVPSGYTVPEIWHVTDVIIFSFWAILFPFTPSPLPPTAQKMKISKNENNIWRYQHLSQVYLESWSYALLLLRYDMWQMWLFFIMDFFLPFLPLPARKIKISKKCKKHLEISSFYTIVIFCQKPWSYALLFLRYDAWQM